VDALVRAAVLGPAVLVLALAGGCGGGDDEARGGSEGSTAGEARAGGPRAPGARSGSERRAGPRTVEWQDPEPPDAQARAEAAVLAAWNRDKTAPLGDARTARLAMRIGTLVDRTGRIGGGSGRIARTEGSLDQRLDRLGAEVSETEVRIRLSGSVLFDFDSDAIRADAERTLSEVAEVVQAYPGRPVRIEGHTDSIASDAYNQALSERRAAAVKTWLAGHGVEAGRMATAGFGESRPAADNATAAGRQQNRRVEIVVERAGG
jgi:outer membrane protein OmpA-like peptidoglycan-associated protein